MGQMVWTLLPMMIDRNDTTCEKTFLDLLRSLWGGWWVEDNEVRTDMLQNERFSATGNGKSVLSAGSKAATSVVSLAFCSINCSFLSFLLCFNLFFSLPIWCKVSRTFCRAFSLLLLKARSSGASSLSVSPVAPAVRKRTRIRWCTREHVMLIQFWSVLQTQDWNNDLTMFQVLWNPTITFLVTGIRIRIAEHFPSWHIWNDSITPWNSLIPQRTICCCQYRVVISQTHWLVSRVRLARWRESLALLSTQWCHLTRGGSNFTAGVSHHTPPPPGGAGLSQFFIF